MSDASLPVACGGTLLVSDDFEDGAPSSAWTTFSDTTLAPLETGGALKVSLAGTHGGGQYAGYESVVSEPFAASCTVAELAAAPAVDGAYAYLRIGTSSDKVLLTINRTTVVGRYDAGSVTIVGMVAYDPATMKFVRVREQAGTWTWELSADGVAFNELGSAVVSLPTDSTVELGAATTADIVAGTGSVAWGSIVATK